MVLDIVAAGLTRANNLFLNGDYRTSLQVGLSTIKLVDENIERKILAYEKNE